MGKHKHKRRLQRSDPLRKPDGRDQKDVNEKVLPVIAALKAARLPDRAVALSAIGGLIDDHRMRGLLVSHELIDILLTHTLSDNSLELVAEGFGVLRNLLLEDPGLVHDLIEKRVLIPANAAASRARDMYVTGLEQLARPNVQELCELSENLCGLGAALVLSADAAVDAAIMEAPALVALLSIVAEKCPSASAVTTALEFAYCLSQSGLADVGTIHRNPNVHSLIADAYELGISLNIREYIPGLVGQLVERLNSAPSDAISAAVVFLEVLGQAATVAPPDEVKMALKILLESIENAELRAPAASALNNACWALNAAQAWSPKDAEHMIPTAVALLESSDDILSEPALGLAGALGVQLPAQADLSAALAPRLAAVLNNSVSLESENDELRALVVACGTLGKTPQLLEPSTELVFRCLHQSDSADVLADALDALFELYGGDEPEIAEFWAVSSLQAALEKVAPRVNGVLSAAEGERMTEVAENMQNFIIYKS